MTSLDALRKLSSNINPDPGTPADAMRAALENWLAVHQWKPGVEYLLVDQFILLAEDKAGHELWVGFGFYAIDILEALYKQRLSPQPAGAETAGGDK